MSALVPTEPCTPAKPTAKRGLAPRPPSPLSPTPPQPGSDSAEFAAMFGPPTDPGPAGTVTLRLAGGGDADLTVPASSGSPPHDGDSPAGAAMVESPCPTQPPLRLEVVNKALQMFQNATSTSEATPGAGEVTTTTTTTSNVRLGPMANALQLQPSLMSPSAGLRVVEAGHAAPARVVALRDATVADAQNAVASAPSTSTAGCSSSFVVPTTCGGATAGPSAAVAVRTGSSGRLAEKMRVERVIAMGREFWLAYGEVFRASTAWYRDGRADILVHRGAADAAREAQAAHAADPDTVPAPEAPGRALGWTIGREWHGFFTGFWAPVLCALPSAFRRYQDRPKRIETELDMSRTTSQSFKVTA
ncbi:hypothetical protein K466DRAFT_598741 [Polyporus arcularius HHB13444]|uniref:Uncharacterized protein n=1 Tax=Polyporus arcularius HHB13444 TaxID=1314778 RepID=A0A5C3PF28_9APHY|nr:hypothetical protein K466DRAFT_598741 [Polyporus arcularius HHB13444]